MRRNRREALNVSEITDAPVNQLPIVIELVRDRPEKILALQFKYFGDAVLMTPALRALREHFPKAEIHLLVPAEIAPLFQHTPWLTRTWAMPRKRGKATLRQTWPLIRALRRERFDRSVSFASNDRGAILSFVVGAKKRLGWEERGGFLGRQFLYNQSVDGAKIFPHESAQLAHLLSAWQVPMPRSLAPEIHADPALAEAARKLLPQEHVVVCHVASSVTKKEWPLTHWVELQRLIKASGKTVVFTTARGAREAALTAELRRLAPDTAVLPEIAELPLFLAVLARAGIFVSGDTGPLHFASGLGVPTLSLFGPTPSSTWAPAGERHQFLEGGKCVCAGNTSACTATRHCLAEISPAQVFQVLQRM